MARPIKLTDEITECICGLIEKGNYPSTAAAACGIGESTFYKYMQWGEYHTTKSGRKARPKKQFKEFRERIKKSEKIAETHYLNEIRKAAIGDENRKPQWQAAAWVLERKYGDKWGNKLNLEHAGEIKLKHDISERKKELIKNLREAENDINKRDKANGEQSQ